MTQSVRRYVCARCGKRMPLSALVFSRWTRQRYCVDIDACTRRAGRRQKEEVK